ncbi:(2Fe-2S)-binding protein [Tepidibacter hydrothermalis]|uniref:(2Fe-2S)-binding protein n=1 Tax=Tepidibacter hydrothermalis TaxID=3036126 RepID=A0ABY8E985_9FIRM|nr:(2Fe-2S)-binding protein [Tepidibacter hydrothermalis]WFD09376.1 (2Fe-2S)-binding protein [Tepidibacter hydrothermalis]
MKNKCSLKVNGKNITVEVSDTTTLLEVLRDHLGLTGTKEGCGKGECGACTVLLNGKAVNSCIVFAHQVEGQEVITIEGLNEDPKSKHIQEAFIDEGAVQCGFCTPGMVVSSKALLIKKKKPSKEDIREGLSGNLCRCTGYTKIINAVEEAARRIEDEDV